MMKRKLPSKPFLLKDDALLSDRERRIYDFLHQTPVGVLSTVDPNGEPHGVVIYISVATDFSISFLTKTLTRKYDNIKHNNHVMITVFDAVTQTTVQITGIATEQRDNFEVNAVAGRILAATMQTSANGLPPISKLQEGNYTAFSVKPVRIRMAVYARPDPGDYDELFESIESFEVPGV